MRSLVKYHSKHKQDKLPRWINVALIIITFGFLLSARLYVNQAITGDEPHYLLMDYSLVHDHDLNLANNYKNKDYLSFYPGLLTPFEQVGANQEGPKSTKQYSIHTIGLPILVLPGFLIDEEWGVVTEMVMIATLVIYLTWIWCFRLTNNRNLSYVSSAFLLFCFSFTGLAGYIYPDMIIAAIALGSLIIIDGYYDRKLFQLIFGLLVGFLVLVHFKGLALTGPLLLIMVYKNWRYKKTIPWLAFIGALPLIAYFFISLYQWFGVLNPSKTYSQGYNFLSPPVPIISALLFDSIRGLLVNNPIICLVFVGLPIWHKLKREEFFITLVATVPFIGVLSTFSGYQGGDSSIDRYMIDFLPIFIPAIAFAMSQFKRPWQRFVTFLLFMATLLTNIYYLLTKAPYVRHEVKSPLLASIQNHSGLALSHLFPTFSDTNTIGAVSTIMYKHGVIKLIFDYIFLAVLIAYGIFLSRSAKLPKTKKL